MTHILSKQAEITLKCLVVDDEENAIDGVVDIFKILMALK